MLTYPPDLPSVKFVRMLTIESAPWWRRIFRWIGRRNYVFMEDWQLLLDHGIILQFPKLKGCKSLIVEKHFLFDGASVPRLFNIFFAPTNLLLLGSTIHDVGYRNGNISAISSAGSLVNIGSDWTRADWDKLFRLITAHYNHTRILSWIPWAMVRVCGWMSYRR